MRTVEQQEERERLQSEHPCKSDMLVGEKASPSALTLKRG